MVRPPALYRDILHRIPPFAPSTTTTLTSASIKMDYSIRRSPFALLFAYLFAFTPLSLAERVIESESLNPCQTDSRFSATLFNVAFTPGNNSLSFNIDGVSDISGNVTAEILFIVYGFNAYHQTINPCTSSELDGLCPMNEGQIQIQSANTQIDASVVKNIPGKFTDTRKFFSTLRQRKALFGR